MQFLHKVSCFKVDDIIQHKCLWNMMITWWSDDGGGELCLNTLLQNLQKIVQLGWALWLWRPRHFPPGQKYSNIGITELSSHFGVQFRFFFLKLRHLHNFQTTSFLFLPATRSECKSKIIVLFELYLRFLSVSQQLSWHTAESVGPHENLINTMLIYFPECLCVFCFGFLYRSC